MRLATLHHRVRRARSTGSVSIMILLLVLGLMSRPAKAEEPVLATLPGKPFLYFGNYEPASVGYTLSEFAVSGQARAYAKGVDAESTGIPMGKTPYKTRVVVMRPNDPTKFNGSVIVEWMNVTGGLDVPVEWITAHREFIRRGYAYVGVTAQKVGIDGGKARSEGISASLKTVDPKRYGSLLHPGDAYAFDMFSDVGRLLRSQHASTLLGPLATKRILAVGESQSAFFLTTYANSVDPIAAVYDGFLIHSRSGAAVGLDGRSLFDHGEAGMMTPVRLRRDLRVPVLQLITETDLLRLGNSIGFHAARQPDTKRLRTWEIAGAAHADNYLIAAGMSDVPDQSIGALAKAMAPRLA